MSIFDRFRKPPAPQQPTENSAMRGARALAASLQMPKGRESRDELASLFDRVFGQDAPLPGYPGDSLKRIIRVLRYLGQRDEDAKGTIRDMQALANPGHDFEFLGGARAQRAARDEIDAWQETIFDGNGLDMLINHQIHEAMVAGALSIEWYPQRNRKGVENVAMVPAEYVRIRRLENGLEYRQVDVTIEPILLNPLTYSYVPASLEGNSPYGVPLFIASPEPMERKVKLLDAEQRVIRLMAESALIKAGIAKPTPQEMGVESVSDPRYADAYASYLDAVASMLSAGMEKGILVGLKDDSLDIVPLAQSAAGAAEIVKSNQHRTWNALGTLPFMRGELQSANYALSRVVYPILLAQAVNLQLILKKQIEFGVNLHLRLRGILAQALVHFDAPPNPFILEEAQADLTRMRTDELGKKVFGAAWAKHAMRRWDIYKEDAKDAPDWWAEQPPEPPASETDEQDEAAKAKVIKLRKSSL